jgi:DNA repair protein RadC
MLQEGTINHAPIYPREIIKKALDIGATSFILIHNHPSGDQTPSDQDILITSKLATAAKLFDITLLDHLIISKNGYNFIQKPRTNPLNQLKSNTLVI